MKTETRIYLEKELYDELQCFFMDNPDLFQDEEGCISFNNWLGELIQIGFDKVKQNLILVSRQSEVET